MKPSLAIFLQSSGRDRVHHAVSLALAASSMGWSCHLFLLYGALASYVDGSWNAIRVDDGEHNSGPRVHDAPLARRLERGFENASLPSLDDMVEKARREEGGLRIYACSASVNVLSLDPDAVRRRVDEVVGIPTMLRIAESCRFAWHI